MMMDFAVILPLVWDECFVSNLIAFSPGFISSTFIGLIFTIKYNCCFIATRSLGIRVDSLYHHLQFLA